MVRKGSIEDGGDFKFNSVNEVFDAIEEGFWPINTWNMFQNYEYLKWLLNTHDRNLFEEPPELGTKGPAIVTASGPSLDLAIPYLNKIRDKHSAPIWCSSTQMWALYHQGVTPDYVVVHDSNLRRCKGHENCNSYVWVDETGVLKCITGGHVQEGENREELIRSFHIHRWAPDIPVQPIVQPGVFLEFMKWPAIVDRGKFFHLDTNPIIKLGEGWVKSRDIQTAQYITRMVETYASTTPSRGTEQDRQNLNKLAGLLYNGPMKHAKADMITESSVTGFGAINIFLKHPIMFQIPTMGSTTGQAAMLAWIHGYSPIYFVGYDLCFWKGRSRHNGWFYDGSMKDYGPITPNNEYHQDGVSGFRTDLVQQAEKRELLHYASKQFNEDFVCPGLRCVEVVCDKTSGELELFPRIGIDELARGGKREIPQLQTAAKITATLMAREMEARKKSAEAQKESGSEK